MPESIKNSTISLIANPGLRKESLQQESFTFISKPGVLLDTGVNMTGSYKELVQEKGYTTGAVVEESRGIGVPGVAGVERLLPEGRFFRNFTEKDFNFDQTTGLYTLTSGESSLGQSTIYMEKLQNITTSTEVFCHCPHCHNCPAAIFTNASSGMQVFVCPGILDPGKYKRYTDFGLIVRNILFPDRLQLFTEDSCLGWSSACLGSFFRKNDKGDLWQNYYRDSYDKLKRKY